MQRTARMQRAVTAAGLACLCFWLQLSLQNLYIAGTYADHEPRLSTLIMAVFVGAMFAGLMGLIAFSRRLRPEPLKRGATLVCVVTLVLLLVYRLAVADYRLALTLCLAGAAGLSTACLCVMWGFALRSSNIRGSLLLLFAANLGALIVLFLLFSWAGQLVWFDFPYGRGSVLYKALLAVSLLGACCLCPSVPDEGPRHQGSALSREGRAAWRNMLLGQGRLLGGVLLFSFCAALHWEINAMRNGNAFEISWPWMGHEVVATAMAFWYVLLTGAVLVVGLLLLRVLGKRAHVRTVLTALFYLVGSAFFVPGMLGFEMVSSAGLTIVGMFFFCTSAFVLLCGERPMVSLALPTLVALFWMLLVAGLAAGLLVSWAIAPRVYNNDAFCVAFTALSLFFVMAAPAMLFRATTPALAVSQNQGDDTVAVRCRALAMRGGLSPREAEVAELAARGYSAPAIASTLFISENTVKVHMRHIYEKLNIHTKQELIRLVEAQGE